MSKGFVQIRVKGGKQLRKKLLKMDKRMAGKALKAGMKEALEPVKILAKQRADKDSGRMARSIRIAAFSKRNFAGAKVQTGTRKQLGLPADSKFYYPLGIEYGTRKRRARPFMRTSLHDKRQVVLNRVIDDINRALISA